tara:strand:+ start:817 stop:1194 length:378 start_codon:yes stop_codon:yes gene_type:complete
MITQKNWYTLDMLLKMVEKLVKPFTGIPAPKVLKDDPWFGPAPILSVTQEEYVAMRYQLELENQLIPQSEDKPREVDNIHAVMYDIATNGGKTTTQLDPMPSLGGGSEGYQSGPGGWKSGIGFNL